MSADSIRSLFNGEIFHSEAWREQYKLFGLIAVLIFCYILSGYQAIRQQHTITDLKHEVLDAKFEYMTIHAEYANITKQSEILKQLRTHESTLQTNNNPLIQIAKIAADE